MQFFLMATGECKKLRPLTALMPSPMVPILQRPVMSYPVELLARFGAKQILVALYHHSALIEEQFGDGRRWNVTMNYLLQRQPLGSAGTLKRAEQMINESLLVMPADVLLDLDIEAAMAFHRAHGGLATLISSNAPAQIKREQQQPTLSAMDNTPLTEAAFYALSAELTGAYILEPEVLSLIPTASHYTVAKDLLPALFRSGAPVYQYRNNNYWNPLQSFEDLHGAQTAMLATLCDLSLSDGQPALRYPFQDGKELAPGIWCGTHTVIHPTAKLIPPLFIGEDCRIGAGSELGPESILGAHTVVDEGATIEESTILHHTYVGRLVNIQQRIVAQNLMIDRATGSALPVTDPFLLGKVTAKTPPLLLRYLFERLVAGFLVVLLLPLLLTLALLIMLVGGVAPFCWVERIGCKPALISRESAHPTVLRLLRLRTQLPNQRFHPLGQWLEQWEGHRLPELWSVLRGELALVGVKPLTAEEESHLTEDWQRVRYQVAAGFTGLWYSQPNPAEQFDNLCMADSYQAATDSWQQALLYLGQTPLAWLRATGRRSHPNQLANPSEVRSQPVVQ